MLDAEWRVGQYLLKDGKVVLFCEMLHDAFLRWLRTFVFKMFVRNVGGGRNHRIHVHNSSSMIGREACFFILGLWGFGGCSNRIFGMRFGVLGSFFRTRVTAGVSKPPISPNLSNIFVPGSSSDKNCFANKYITSPILLAMAVADQTVWDLQDLMDDPETTESIPTPSADSYLIIDNGSYQVRAGYSNNLVPSVVSDSIVHKYQDSNNQSSYHLGRHPPPHTSNSRSPFDADVIVHYASMEHLLDEVFKATEYRNSTPIVLTETVCNPTRSELVELLMECYEVPAVTLCLDSLLSVYSSNHSKGADSDTLTRTLVINLGNAATHVTLFDEAGKRTTRRINYGGQAASEYLLKLLQCKYPMFPDKMTLLQARMALTKLCYVSDKAADIDILSTDRVIQYPFAKVTTPDSSDVTRRRREHMEKMRQLAIARRDAKEREREAYLMQMQQCLADKEWDEMGFDTKADLEAEIKRTEDQLRKKKDVEVKEQVDYSLLEVPDAELDGEQIKEKRRLRLMKSGADARERIKQEREAREKEVARQKELSEQRRREDYEGWKQDLYAKRAAILTSIKERAKRATLLQDRRSKESSKRLKTVVKMGIDNDEEDQFGANDADWDVYQRDEDSLLEGEVEETLAQIETELEQHDPGFGDVLAAEHQPTLLDYFYSGVDVGKPVTAATPHRLHLNVERSRVTEPVFQPSIVGVEQAGLVECIRDVLVNNLKDPQGLKIYMTGGWSLQAGFKERIEGELQSWFPTGHFPGVIAVPDPLMAPFMGACHLVNTQRDLVQQCAITQQWYSEHGGHQIPHTAWFTNTQ